MSNRTQARYDRIWKVAYELQEKNHPGKYNDGFLHTWDKSECVCPKCIGQVKFERQGKRVCFDCGYSFYEMTTGEWLK